MEKIRNVALSPKGRFILLVVVVVAVCAFLFLGKKKAVAPTDDTVKMVEVVQG